MFLDNDSRTTFQNATAFRVIPSRVKDHEINLIARILESRCSDASVNSELSIVERTSF